MIHYAVLCCPLKDNDALRLCFEVSKYLKPTSILSLPWLLYQYLKGHGWKVFHWLFFCVKIPFCETRLLSDDAPNPLGQTQPGSEWIFCLPSPLPASCWNPPQLWLNAEKLSMSLQVYYTQAFQSLATQWSFLCSDRTMDDSEVNQWDGPSINSGNATDTQIKEIQLAGIHMVYIKRVLEPPGKQSVAFEMPRKNLEHCRDSKWLSESFISIMGT